MTSYHLPRTWPNLQCTGPEVKQKISGCLRSVEGAQTLLAGIELVRVRGPHLLLQAGPVETASLVKRFITAHSPSSELRD